MPGPKRTRVITADADQISVEEALKLSALVEGGVPGIESVPDIHAGTLTIAIDTKKAPHGLVENLRGSGHVESPRIESNPPSESVSLGAEVYSRR